MATLQLPITLSDLAPQTRDWLLAKAARLGVSPQEALAQVLDAMAQKEMKPAA